MDMHSFSHLENELRPQYRNDINNTEDFADLSNTFSSTAVFFLNKAMDGKGTVTIEDVIFTPDDKTLFKFSDKVGKLDKIKESDAMAIIERFAVDAQHRYMHIKKTSEKTNLKMKNSIH